MPPGPAGLPLLVRLERVSIAAVSVLFAVSCGGTASTNAGEPTLTPAADDAGIEQPDDDGAADPAPGGDPSPDDGSGDPAPGASGDAETDAGPTDGNGSGGDDEEPPPPVNDYSTVEVLDVSDGSTTTLRGAVTGDRPVLVWFYAPH